MLSTKFIYVSLMLAATLGAAHAVELQDNTVVCITSSSAKKYNRYVEMHQEPFAKDLFDSAACYFHKGAEEVFVVKEVGGLTQVELKNGFKVWLDSANLQHANLTEQPEQM